MKLLAAIAATAVWVALQSCQDSGQGKPAKKMNPQGADAQGPSPGPSPSPGPAPSPSPSPSPSTGGKKVTYDGFGKAFIKDNCISCHAAGKKKPTLATYADVKKNGEDVLHSIEQEEMPPGKTVKADDLKNLKAWVAAGMPEKEAAVDEGSGDEPTYDAKIKSILEKNCTSCHKSGKTKPDLSTKAAAKKAAQTSLEQIEDEKMPPKGPLSESDQKAFKAWVDANSP